MTGLESFLKVGGAFFGTAASGVYSGFLLEFLMTTGSLKQTFWTPSTSSNIHLAVADTYVHENTIISCTFSCKERLWLHFASRI